jgi:hypothetical protein
MTNILRAVFVLALEKFDNPTLAAFNRVMQTLGRVPEENMSYAPALKAGLINENGNPAEVELEIIRDASAFEVNRRVTAGTFV